MSTIKEKKVNEHAHPEALEYAIKFFSEAHGDIANRESFGLDIFTPYTADRKISLISETRSACGQGLKQIHALSIKTEDAENNVLRVHCMDFKPVETGPGVWWSIAMVEYETNEDATRATSKLLKRNPNAPVALMSEIVKASEGTPAEETLSAMCNIPARTQGLSCKTETLPRRFDIDKLMLIYDPSASFMNAGGMWGYPVRRSVNNTEGAASSKPEEFDSNE
jgi:hypothetical protein